MKQKYHKHDIICKKCGSRKFFGTRYEYEYYKNAFPGTTFWGDLVLVCEKCKERIVINTDISESQLFFDTCTLADDLGKEE